MSSNFFTSGFIIFGSVIGSRDPVGPIVTGCASPISATGFTTSICVGIKIRVAPLKLSPLAYPIIGIFALNILSAISNVSLRNPPGEFISIINAAFSDSALSMAMKICDLVP